MAVSDLTAAVFLIPGMRLRVSMIIEVMPNSRGIGFFAWPFPSINFKGKTFTLIKGFGLDNESVGTLAGSGPVGVVYSHIAPEKNSIYFFALTGEMGQVDLVAVPVHDHSSIVQGGPAYATYFNDDEIVQ
jgi:hypothetical protein